MRKRLRDALAQLWRRSQEDSGERRAAAARARFWVELREGEREAEAQAHQRRTAAGPS